jgi:hypothetical protein
VNDSSASVLGGSDPENQFLTVKIVAHPANGTITGSPPSVSYRPSADFVGTDSFTFTVSDGEKTSDPATVTIHVVDRNRAPTATPQMFAATEDTTSDVTLTGSDPNGDTLSFFVRNGPVHGTVSSTFGSSSVTYRPFSNYNGPDSFIALRLRRPAVIGRRHRDDRRRRGQRSPVAVAVARTLNEDTSTTITLQAPTSRVPLTSPSGRSASGVSLSLPSTPRRIPLQRIRFVHLHRVRCEHPVPATVSLTVVSVNDVPVAVDGSATTVRTPRSTSRCRPRTSGQP